MFVSSIYRKTKMDITRMLEYSHNIEATVETLVMIDYAYHNEDENYQEGLSFLDRLHKKLSNFFEISWDIEYLKDLLRKSENPSEDFIAVLKEILTQEMMECYGI